MPRPATVTAEGVVELLRSIDKPFVDTGDVADHFGVTKQAVRDRKNQLLQDPRLRAEKAGRSTVYVLNQAQETERPALEEQPEPDGYGFEVGSGLPKSGYHPTFMSVAKWGGLLAILLWAVSVTSPLFISKSIAYVILVVAVFTGLISGGAYVAAKKFQNEADPSFTWGDVGRAIWGEK